MLLSIIIYNFLNLFIIHSVGFYHSSQFMFTFNFIYCWSLLMTFIAESNCPPNTLFCMDSLKPLVQNLASPVLHTFKSERVVLSCLYILMEQVPCKLYSLTRFDSQTSIFHRTIPLLSSLVRT
jgi:hypothetical protein